MSEPRMLSTDEVREIQDRLNMEAVSLDSLGIDRVSILGDDIPNLCHTVERLRADSEIARLAREYVAAWERWRTVPEGTGPNDCHLAMQDARYALIAAVGQEGR